MFIKRKNFEAIKRENEELKFMLQRSDNALQVMTKRHSERGKRIIELEKTLAKRTGKHDPATGKFTKK